MKKFCNTSIVLKYLFFLYVIMTFNSCKEDTIISVSDANRQFFRLDLKARDKFYIDKQTETFITAYFYASSTNDTPLVNINGHKMETFYYSGSNSDLYGQLHILYQSKVVFSISSGNKVTTGTFIMPSKPYNVTCSGFPLTDSIPTGTPYTKIPVDSIYHFKWDCDNYDYFGVLTGQGESWGTALFEKEFTRIKSNDWTHWDIPYGLFITVCKETKLEPGITPPYSGSYGSGYVSATYYTAFRYVPN
jgi:hypothetical protein